MRKWFSCLFVVLFVFVIYGCTNPPVVTDPEPEDPVVVDPKPDEQKPEDPVVVDPEPVSPEPDKEEEMKDFTFDVSKLTPTKYSDAVEDSSLLSLNPTVVKKGNLVDIEVSYGNESAEGYCGRAYTVEVFIDGNWYDILGDYKSFVPEQYGDSAFIFTDEAVPLFQINKQIVPMTTAFQNLPVGRYRVVKELNGLKYAEFTIE